MLSELSFTVAAGEIVALLGPNGAGKTTTLSVLATLRRPAAGAAWVAGRRTDVEGRAVRRCIGYVPQALAVYPSLTATENARCFARLLGLDRRAACAAVAEALALVGLDDRGDDVVATFSGGMQRRLNLACGLLHRPRVLLLDEPTVGVDPQSRERIFAAVRAQATAGAAVLYSTHQMEEAERVADRAVLIDRGRVIAAGSVAALVAAHGRGLRLDLATRAPLPRGWIDGLAGARVLDGPRPSEPPGRGHPARVAIDALGLAPRVLERAAVAGGEVLEFHLVQPSLQDVFLELTGHGLRD